MKKRNYLLLAFAAMAFVQAKADVAPNVMLSHNGQRTMYMWNEVQNAVDAASDGDTIYLSNGTFSAFNISKRIMVRGTGPETIIQGSCNIYIGGTTRISMPVLDALTFTGDVNVSSAYEQFTIRKCQIKNLNFTETDFHDVKLYQCDILETLHLTQNVKEFNCFNTKIRTLHPYDYTTGHAYFDHCNIREINDYITATFDNCVLRTCKKNTSGSNYAVVLKSSTLNYCIYPTRGGHSCYVEIGATPSLSSGWAFLYDNSMVFNNCYQVNINAENVVDYSSDSYIGNDDTKVGVYGSKDFAFRRTPELPRVTKNSVSVDAVNRKLNVTLTLTKE